ncbi:MAG: hypothetical protein WD851_09340 [Pirellulales bacterium]
MLTAHEIATCPKRDLLLNIRSRLQAMLDNSGSSASLECRQQTTEALAKLDRQITELPDLRLF